MMAQVPLAGWCRAATATSGTTSGGGSNGLGTVFALAVSSIEFIQTAANPTVGTAPLTVNFSSSSH